MGGDYIVATRPHHSCHVTSHIMYIIYTIIPNTTQSFHITGPKYYPSTNQRPSTSHGHIFAKT